MSTIQSGQVPAAEMNFSALVSYLSKLTAGEINEFFVSQPEFSSLKANVEESRKTYLQQQISKIDSYLAKNQIGLFSVEMTKYMNLLNPLMYQSRAVLTLDIVYHLFFNPKGYFWGSDLENKDGTFRLNKKLKDLFASQIAKEAGQTASENNPYTREQITRFITGHFQPVNVTLSDAHKEQLFRLLLRLGHKFD